MKLTTLTTSGSKGSLTVNDAVFGAGVNKPLIAQALRVYIARQHPSISSVKTRAEITATKRKWYRQKGTGNARHGAKSAPLFVGGGVTHGPKPDSKTLTLSKQLKRKAMTNILSAQAQQCVVVDAVEKLSGKTKPAASLLSQVSSDQDKVLVVLPTKSDSVVKSLRNLPNVLITTATNLNPLEVASADVIVLTKKAIAALEARLITT